jgi:hypothetical protein
MESLMDVKTLVVLESCLDVDVDLSPENELAQDQLIALKLPCLNSEMNVYVLN